MFKDFLASITHNVTSLIGTALGRWTLTRLIGRGGMGRVYEARGGLMNRKVALKVLNEELAEDAEEGVND